MYYIKDSKKGRNGEDRRIKEKRTHHTKNKIINMGCHAWSKPGRRESETKTTNADTGHYKDKQGD